MRNILIHLFDYTIATVAVLFVVAGIKELWHHWDEWA